MHRRGSSRSWCGSCLRAGGSCTIIHRREPLAALHVCNAASGNKGIQMTDSTEYEELIRRFKESRLLDSVGAVVGWDQHTYMPPAGAGHRAEQMGFLARLGHQMLTDR